MACPRSQLVGELASLPGTGPAFQVRERAEATMLSHVLHEDEARQALHSLNRGMQFNRGMQSVKQKKEDKKANKSFDLLSARL